MRSGLKIEKVNDEDTTCVPGSGTAWPNEAAILEATEVDHEHCADMDATMVAMASGG